MTTSHEARCGRPASRHVSRPAGQLLYLIPARQHVKSAVRDDQASVNSTLRQLRGVGTSIVDPKAVHTQGVHEMGGGSPLEGGEAFGLSASLWGEQ